MSYNVEEDPELDAFMASIGGASVQPRQPDQHAQYERQEQQKQQERFEQFQEQQYDQYQKMHYDQYDHPEDYEQGPGRKRKTAPKTEAVKKAKVQENRAVYITNLPLDTDEDEIHECFKKFGIVDKGADGYPRIKMYEDALGHFTGNALLVYLRKEALAYAIKHQNDFWFRPEDAPSSGKNIGVTEADFSYKKHQDGDEVVSKMTRAEKKAAKRVRADLNYALANWSDEDDDVRGDIVLKKKTIWQKICIISHAFTLGELAEDEDAIEEIKTELRATASKFGVVMNVTLYDKEEAGLVTVKFREHASAKKFCAFIHGKGWGDNVKLESRIPEERFEFRGTGKGDDVAPPTEDTTSTPEDMTSPE